MIGLHRMSKLVRESSYYLVDTAYKILFLAIQRQSDSLQPAMSQHYLNHISLICRSDCLPDKQTSFDSQHFLFLESDLGWINVLAGEYLKMSGSIKDCRGNLRKCITIKIASIQEKTKDGRINSAVALIIFSTFILRSFHNIRIFVGWQAYNIKIT